jgi:hypothetical protein
MRRRYRFGMARSTAAERMARTRERRRRGQVLATVRIDRIEMRKLASLGYPDPSLVGAGKGPALDAAAEDYLSDTLALETVPVVRQSGGCGATRCVAVQRS